VQGRSNNFQAPALAKKPRRVLKKTLFAGCSKMRRYKAPEIPRSEAYIEVRRSDEGNTVDGCFSATC
jgi:hypothetical protein